MMDVRYKRDLNSNYMIMTDAEKREENLRRPDDN